ncbi:alkaline phosphatase D family protein [Agarilytica rhodophyticola]|uniref:alkaline phosphatase D family protein n=1 Tax=Agarilytica rhodophyticola TaxID=1737490 RepID=UPI000B34391E|nr:alkaline phosphatase D family protein [Agarilytica rhodophyticola]
MREKMSLVRYLIFFISSLIIFSGAPFSSAENTQHEINVNKKNIDTIAFGSCAKEDRPQPIWNAILREKPDVFVFLGDNIYADTKKPQVIEEKYRKFSSIKGFKTLREKTEVIATWDDHDYGQNDAGEENPIKHESRKIMLDFWREPKDSPRYTQEGGIYTSYYFGDEQHRVQIILLDLRWNRSPINTVNALTYASRKLKDMGPYSPSNDESATFLGEEQWHWLEKELQKPAKVRILGSSLQLLADFTGWEAWANYPKDLERLFTIIKRHRVEGLFVISGDTHWAELSRYQEGLDYPLYDMTASGLTEEWHAVSPNKNRISATYAKANFGLIKIDWSASPITLSLGIKDVNGNLVVDKKLSLSELAHKKN